MAIGVMGGVGGNWAKGRFMKQMQQGKPDLEETVETLQAVVRAQRAQIDVLLASLQGLMAGLDSLEPADSIQAEAGSKPDATLLGNPLDTQLACLQGLLGMDGSLHLCFGRTQVRLC